MKGGKESSKDRFTAPKQRSIRSTLLFHTDAAANDRLKKKGLEQRKPDEGKKRSAEQQRKPIQLSDFLNHKLHSSSSVLPTKHFLNQGKQRTSKTSINQCSVIKSKETDNRSRRCHVIEESVFKQFGHAYSSLHNAESNGFGGDDDGVQICITDNCAEPLKSRKRTSPFTVNLPTTPDGPEVDHHKHPQSHLIVLGDDPKPKHTAFGAGSSQIKKPRPLYNHYKSGDYESETFDDDEVGCNNIWEGIGSTTLGGLEWH